MALTSHDPAELQERNSSVRPLAIYLERRRRSCSSRFAQECEQCQNVKLEREVETLSVALEPGMKDGQARVTRTAS